MNSNYYKIVLKFLKVKYGMNLLLKGCPLIYNCRGASLSIGHNVTINSSFLSNLAGIYCRSIIVTRRKEAIIDIGNNVGISGATIYARQGIYIGNNTAIGANCKIFDNDFHPLDPAIRLSLKQEGDSGNSDLIPTKEVRIGNDCFIGCNSIILKGTVLGDGCVVGAGAVVSGQFPPKSMIVGNPARAIRNLE